MTKESKLPSGNKELQPTQTPLENIENLILNVRGKQVMLDRDLARLYGVETKALNQAVKRNLERFPERFMFKLNDNERIEVVTNCDHLNELRFSYQNPYAFTEQVVSMLSAVLKSNIAINTSHLPKAYSTTVRFLMRISLHVLYKCYIFASRMLYKKL